MDKTVWGYKVYVGAAYLEPPRNNLSFFAQVSFSLIPILRTRLTPMFEGCPISPGVNVINILPLELMAEAK
jgi:hypothetical protein